MQDQNQGDPGDYTPRPNDFLVEPMLVPFESAKPAVEPDIEPEQPPSLFARLTAWLRPWASRKD